MDQRTKGRADDLSTRRAAEQVINCCKKENARCSLGAMVSPPQRSFVVAAMRRSNSVVNLIGYRSRSTGMKGTGSFVAGALHKHTGETAGRSIPCIALRAEPPDLDGRASVGPSEPASLDPLRHDALGLS